MTAILSYTYTIKGNISQVRWVESYGATKVPVEDRGRTFTNYRVTVPASDSTFLRRLMEAAEDGARIWWDEVPNVDEAEEAAEAAAIQTAEEVAPIHEAFAAMAAHLRSKGQRPTNRACRDAQIAGLEALLRKRGLNGLEQQEIQAVINDLMFAQPEKAGDIWALTRDRMIALREKAR